MKKILTIIVLLISISCTKEKKEYPFKLAIANSTEKPSSLNQERFNLTTINCDSFNFISTKEVFIYRDGVKALIMSNNFIAVSND